MNTFVFINFTKKIMTLWNRETEITFFKQALQSFATPEQLFYKLQMGYFAYIPKGISSENQTLQSRNSLIGSFTEKWCKDILEPIAKSLNLFAVNGMVCEELGLSRQTSADVAFCTKNGTVQNAENVKAIFEVKMSIVNNYEFKPATQEISYVGDYSSHKGQPSIMRSDSMLKAIGKSINIRVSGSASTKIPIFILGNTPITESYQPKVDFLKSSGVIQGFISVNPNPTNNNFMKQTPKMGFQTAKDHQDLNQMIATLVQKDLNFFSSMISKSKLGEIIRISAQAQTDIERANIFLNMI